MTLEEAAREAYSWLEVATRGDTGKDEDRYVRTKEGRPDWVLELVREAHGDDMLPDDWRYACIQSALGWIVDNGYDEDDGAHAFADAEVDVYTGRRFAWLASNLTRQGYVDQATEEFGASEDIAQAVGMGQYMEATEVFASVITSLEQHIEEEE